MAAGRRRRHRPKRSLRSWHFSRAIAQPTSPGRSCTFAATRCRSGRTRRRSARSRAARGGRRKRSLTSTTRRSVRIACDASTRSGSRGRPAAPSRDDSHCWPWRARARSLWKSPAGRPIVLKRYVDGAEGEPFFQKRAPTQHPEWVETVELRFPSGRTAREIVVRDAAQLLWIVNLGCIDLNPHPVRADDLEHPDELRVDLDPGPGVGWDDVRRVALIVRDVLDEHGLRGWPKTSGSRGMHVNVRIERRWSFDQVRRAALALAREVERRAPE